MLKHVTVFPVLVCMAHTSTAAPLRLPITVKPFENVRLLGPARQNQELRLDYIGDIGNTAAFSCYRDGERVAGLSERLRSYRTSAADVGTLVECALTDPYSGFEMRSPPVGPIRSGTLEADSETITTEVLHTIPEGSFSTDVKNLRQMPSVVTFRGETYFVYVDENLFPIIGKVALDGTVTEARLEPDDAFEVTRDDHHNFSIGVDSQGYLHVAGNMHRYTGLGNSTAEQELPEKYRGQRILLWRSNQPGDISQFDFKGRASDGAPDGTGFTYTAFKSGMDAELYMRARKNLGQTTPFRYPLSAWGLYKYDPERETWTAIEGDIDQQAYSAYFDFTPRAFLWEDNGNDGLGYQGYLSGMMIDFDNTIHIASAVNNNDGPAATHIVYARSNDGGASWERSDGSAIDELPLRVDPGPGQADIVYTLGDNADGFFTQVHVSASMSGAPVMTSGTMNTMTDSGFDRGSFRLYDDRIKVWSTVQPDPLEATNDTSIVTDVNGITTLMHHKGYGQVYRMYSGDITGYKTQVFPDYGLSGHDERALREKAAIVGLGYWSNAGDTSAAHDLKLLSIKTDVAGIPLPELAETDEQVDGDWRWRRTQIGGRQGTATIANSIVKLTGTGAGFDENGLKSLQFTNKLVTGDFELLARVINVDYTGPDSFAGLMIANGPDSESDAVAAYITASANLMTHRQIGGVKTPLQSVAREASEWLKIARIDGLIRVYHGSNGKDWTILSETFVPSLNPQLHVGLINGGGVDPNDVGDKEPNGVTRIDNIQLFKM
ncbi:BNR repeat-containing protein [Tateyamaria omphalii]|uniref:BNR-4 repeat-containing protein n=1 Tax=Tateyamaria omphalii TaxID=299262 RepID=UPI001C997654|nr:BNR-4 repeat-containing protein [Tateyamaria omphalii]MBY5932741.1 BNR repeat-containing protein [Tateyamaria omphalii]